MIRFLFLLLPLLEIAGFVLVGREIGVMATLGLVLLGVVVGALLLRRGGLAAFGRLRAEVQAGRDPAPALVQGFTFVAAGVLFMLPGFLSDIIAIILLLPPVRNRALRLINARTVFAGMPGGRAAQPRPVINLERADYTREPQASPAEPGKPNPASPWASG
ncbi:MAG: membrane protein FxsA [Mesorhizobium amorphae]|nr:MAG: membrane protein FxsA [Mesorhizobium amorphae]